MNDNELRRLAHALNDLPGERWAPIPGYERTYRISTAGRVFSIPRPTTPGGLLKWSPDQRGYPRVTLVQDGKQWKRRVHVLVMRAFVGEPPAGMEIRHLDGDPTNPDLSNLAYGTHRENGLDTTRHGANWLANKTHCPRNHPYDETNTLRSGGRRYCRACMRARQK